MTRILIPTDLSAQSLKIAEEAFKMYPDDIIDVILVYPYRLPVWNSDLYWFSPAKIIKKHEDEQFAHTKDELVRKYFKNISSIYVELFTGVNSLAFENFRVHHQIQTAVLPQNGFLDFSHDDTFDPTNLIVKKVPIINRVQIENVKHSEDYQGLKPGLFSLIQKVFRS
ncbi:MULTISPECIES: hypothetical protein [Maribacter]|uniref:Universal stress protein n=1 Tax=Maribacter flavus TaxID=1658664 RepID=A0ABU7IIZ6_9FLAO|nr:MULTISPECIES: hypothetical protein [Maribacter]MDC6405828.1 hypothetical protein [Maribacter sp. PR66]MEE1972920.1 hypothetical protein [Maribacter flavus]